MITDTRLTFRCSVLAGTIHGGYTENGMGGAVVCKLNYVDYAGERVIEIRDFDENDIWLYYDYYIHKIKYRHCSECNKIIVIEKMQDKRTLYCQPCREKKTQQIKSDYYYSTKEGK